MKKMLKARDGERVQSSNISNPTERIAMKITDEYMEKRQAEIAREVRKLEAELADIDELLFGEAATDYKRAAELEERKNEAEEELMMLYEEDEAVSAELEEWN